MAPPYAVRVKICGVTSPHDALAAERAGADAVGVILHAHSRRAIDLERAEAVVAPLGPFIARVGVVADAPPDVVDEAIARLRLDVVQFHGGEGADEVERVRPRVAAVKAVSFRDDLDVDALARFPADAILVDGLRPGSGEPFDWRRAGALALLPRWILAGGLSPANVAEAIDRLRPYGVDVASGVEASPGVKDHAAVDRFVAAAKAAR